jgi:aldose sugar dehydrogenase
MTLRRVLILGAVVILVMIVLAPFVYRQVFAPTTSTLPQAPAPEPAELRVLARNLAIPWDVARLPDGALLVTERPGTLARIDSDGTVSRIEVPKVSPVGEGGLMGMALHPAFAENNHLYLYRTILTGNTRTNEVVRFVYHNDHRLSDETVIVGGIPGARFHDGGRIEFGPDGMLYITTGDAGTPALAQDLDSLAGKLLRVTDTGEIPADNPFGTIVYSYGHRNSQGITWDAEGRLWSTEHGRSGVLSGLDELNLIVAGGNYGWPDIEGDATRAGMLSPVVHSGTDETWAPASLTAVGNTLYFAGLRGSRLYRADVLADDSVTLSTYFAEEYGRLRAARIIGNTLYITTSNTDGRGRAGSDDDMLIAVPLSLLEVGVNGVE